MNTETPTRRALVNPSPSQPGHVAMHGEDNKPLDSSSGPRDFMIRVYREMGYTVIEAAQG